ncbi:MAG: molybdopterin-dependent oxidoreductase [Negativicutes bacterium]|nr:molybdopterin-dependent oxidoreductase [Negativicutes bacterium]
MSSLSALKTPIFAVEGILHITPADYRLEVCGLVEMPRIFSLKELKTLFTAQTINSRLTSVSGWSVRADWHGILWKDFLDKVRPLPEARYVLFTSAGDYTTAVWLPDLADSKSMLVWEVNGQPLEDEYGGPVRMIIPNLWGYKSCKWLTRIQFLPRYETGYWELRGYSHRGQIEPGETFDVNSQKWRLISGGEVTEF